MTAFNAAEKKKQTIAEYFEDIVAKGESFRGSERLPASALVNRMHVTSTLMMSGIPISKLDDDVSGFRRLLERSVGSISVGHLRELIPHIRKTETQRVNEEVKACGPVSVIFDGTTDVCEVAAVIVRWCDNQFRPHQRLLAHVLATMYVWRRVNRISC